MYVWLFLKEFFLLLFFLWLIWVPFETACLIGGACGKMVKKTEFAMFVCVRVCVCVFVWGGYIGMDYFVFRV